MTSKQTQETPIRDLADSVEQVVLRILARIEEEASACDAKAEQACIKSKYSIQDYWMCVEFKFQQLHDDLAREHGLPRRCRTFAFRKRLNEFRKSTKEDAENNKINSFKTSGARGGRKKKNKVENEIDESNGI
jgi:hypothetical protein